RSRCATSSVWIMRRLRTCSAFRPARSVRGSLGDGPCWPIFSGTGNPPRNIQREAMNNDPAPLEPDELDELLSADLDGDLADAARERGSDVETARARIAATPGAPERRAALAAARELLAEAPELSELDAARLRADAVRAAEAAAPARNAPR